MRLGGLVNWKPMLWSILGAVLGLSIRIVAGWGQVHGLIAGALVTMLMVTPFAIGAVTIYGLHAIRPSIWRMLFAPWLTVLLLMVGAAIGTLEGFPCVAMATPIALILASCGGLFMGLALRLFKRNSMTLPSLVMLPFLTLFIDHRIPENDAALESRQSVVVAAPAHTIFTNILNARDIHPDELGPSWTQWIGVPRPLEGVNVVTDSGEVRYTKWERGVHFRATVTERTDDRSIRWRYVFDADSFPPNSLDDHINIGGHFFDLIDTMFELVPIGEKSTRLVIVSHYRVTTNINFYAVRVARFFAADFTGSILHLYKVRSERPAR